MKGWIALIKRGECKFDEKVACVYRNGAIGAIVYDFKEVPTLDKMKIDDKTREYKKIKLIIRKPLFFVGPMRCENKMEWKWKLINTH